MRKYLLGVWANANWAAFSLLVAGLVAINVLHSVIACRTSEQSLVHVKYYQLFHLQAA